MSGKVQKLDSQSISALCANQVVIDLATCIKELLENALDAKATRICVTLVDYGRESIEVQDNGFGISAQNLQAIAERGATSKLRNFNDLNEVRTFGFRGEALNSIANVAELTITSRTADSEHGVRTTLVPPQGTAQTGTVPQQNAAIIQNFACNTGTTVMIRSLFHNVPLRLTEFVQNAKSHYNKLVNLLVEYSLIATQCQIILFSGAKGSPAVLDSGEPQTDIKRKILHVLGNKYYGSAEALHVQLERGQISGYVSSKIDSGSQQLTQWMRKNLQFCYVNSRPINAPLSIVRIFNGLYKKFNASGRYFFILNFLLPNSEYDFNLSPDKREIIFKDEKGLCESLRTVLEELHEQLNSLSKIVISGTPAAAKRRPSALAANSTQEINESLPVSDTNAPLKRLNLGTAPDSQFGTQAPPQIRQKSVSSFAEKFKMSFGRKSEPETVQDKSKKDNLFDSKPSTPFNLTPAGNTAVPKQDKADDSLLQMQNEYSFKFSLSNQNFKHTAAAVEDRSSQQSRDCHTTPKFTSLDSQGEGSEAFATLERKAAITTASINTPVKNGFCSVKNFEIKAKPQEVAQQKNCSEEIQFYQKSQKDSHNNRDQSSQEEEEEERVEPGQEYLDVSQLKVQQFKLVQEDDKIEPKHAVQINNNELANTRDQNIPFEAQFQQAREMEEEEKPVSFDKSDFSNLNILGQFNKGFIISILPHTAEIYVVDQHASAEKINYERLLRQDLHTQPLVHPIRLPFARLEVELIEQHRAVFEKSGFKFASSSEGIEIRALPQQDNNICFTADDFVEIFHLLSEGEAEGNLLADSNEGISSNGDKSSTNTPFLRPKKALRLIATRACHMSTKIGEDLNLQEMRKILNALASLQSPWNCPHGRPTMIKTVPLKSLAQQISTPKRIYEL